MQNIDDNDADQRRERTGQHQAQPTVQHHVTQRRYQKDQRGQAENNANEARRRGSALREARKP